MAIIFDELLTKGVRTGQIPSRTQDAREWYRNAAKNYGSSVRKSGTREGRTDFAKINEKKFIGAEPQRLVNTLEPGSMYMFMYDPKWKETLPFYDKFPLIFPFKVESDRFMGINLHYLPLQFRAKLMDSLYTTKNNNRYDESTKLRISYDILKGAAKFRYFEPCIKQYLFKQMQSKFMYVYPSEWDMALFLPLERFEKASKAQVWSATRKQVGR